MVDACAFYDYLSEIRRSLMANSLTINILLMISRLTPAMSQCGLTNKTLGAVVTSTMASMFAGCLMMQQAPTTEIKSVEVTAPAKPTALTEEADAAIKAAEQSVIEARAKRALWTAAVEHLAKAREAAKIFDSGATLLHSKEVLALCALSLRQLSAPPVKW